MNNELNIDGSQEIIDRWQGGNAFISEFSASHGRLVIEIRFNDRDSSLKISCLDTEKICGVVRWSNCHLSIEKINYKTEDDIPIHFVVKDNNNNFEAHCGMIQISEISE